MIWWVLNIIILVVGAYFMWDGWMMGQKTEAYDAIVPFFGGIVLLIIGVISSAIKVIWFW